MNDESMPKFNETPFAVLTNAKSDIRSYRGSGRGGGSGGTSFSLSYPYPRSGSVEGHALSCPLKCHLIQEPGPCKVPSALAHGG
jgi:hypothetical protein